MTEQTNFKTHLKICPHLYKTINQIKMQKIKVTIHNRAYNSWEFTQDDVKVDIPHLIPSKHKLLHDDIINFNGETIVVVESPFRDTILPGVLILGKTYGRLGKRLLYKCIPDNKSLPVFLVPYTVDATFSKVVKNKYIVLLYVTVYRVLYNPRQ